MGRQHGEIMQLSIKTDFRDVQRKVDRLSREMQNKVIPAAINKVAPKARTAMIRQITSEFNIRADEVRSRLRLIKARRNLERWMATLDPFASSRRGRSLNLIRFIEGSITLAEAKRRVRKGEGGAYQLNKSVTRQKALQMRFKIKRRGSKQTVTGAFIGNKGRTVFVRLGDKQLPIKALSTIDVPQMFNTRRVQAEVIKVINRELPIEFDRAIKAAVAGVFR
jgi:hypothetical protein